MDKYPDIARQVVSCVGSAANIVDVENCITRLRIEVADPSKVDVEGLKSIDKVLGVVTNSSNVQIVFGPGVVDKAAAAVEALAGSAAKSDAQRLAAKGAAMKADQKKRNDTAFKRLLKSIANIFVPLIPALIGAGIISGLTGLVTNLATTYSWTGVAKWTPALTVISAGFMGALPIFVGYNAAREFGGTAIIGGAIGAITIAPGIVNVGSMLLIGGQHVDGKQVMLAVGQGGVLGAMFAAILGAYIERWVRSWAPDSLSMLIVPTVTLLIAGGATVLILMSVAGEITTWIGDGANWLLQQAGVFAGFILGGFFLPLVMLGLHQALVPIHTTLIAQYGYTILLPILAMAGGGQVGAAIAVYRRLKKNRSMRNVIKSALPAGFLGVGEPLIYGVSLPLGRPFVTACIGGAFGGAFVGFADQIGITVGAKAVGPSGWALFPLLDGSKGIGPAIAMYAIGLVIAYFAGYIATYYFGFSQETLEELNSEDGTPGVEAQATSTKAPGEALTGAR